MATFHIIQSEIDRIFSIPFDHNFRHRILPIDAVKEMIPNRKLRMRPRSLAKVLTEHFITKKTHLHSITSGNHIPLIIVTRLSVFVECLRRFP